MTKESIDACISDCCRKFETVLNVAQVNDISFTQKKNTQIYLKTLITAGRILCEKVASQYGSTGETIFKDFACLKSYLLRAKYSRILTNQ